MRSMEESDSLLFDFYRKAQMPTSETGNTVKKLYMLEALRVDGYP